MSCGLLPLGAEYPQVGGSAQVPTAAGYFIISEQPHPGRTPTVASLAPRPAVWVGDTSSGEHQGDPTRDVGHRGVSPGGHAHGAREGSCGAGRRVTVGLGHAVLVGVCVGWDTPWSRGHLWGGTR